MKNAQSPNEPIVLGMLKKEKSSKPFFVFLAFALILGVVFGLPYIKDYLATEDNELTRFYNNTISKYFGDDTSAPQNNITTTKKVTSEDGLTLLQKGTELYLKTISINNISIINNAVTYSIKANATINLDLEKYYLRIYNDEKTLLGLIKLTGYAGTTSVSITSNPSFSLNFNNYYLELKEFAENDFVEINLTNNTLTCSDTTNTYTYYFDNNKLTRINHIYNYNDLSNLNTYVNNLTEKRNKSNFFNAFDNCASTTEELDQGFRFTANLDMSKFKVVDLGYYIDYNYYDVNTLAKVIKTDMTSKGYDCK